MTMTNGHNPSKGKGNTVYTGEIPNLPYPEKFDLGAAIRGMHEDGYCIFPGVLNRDEVEAFRAKIDALGGEDAQYDVPKWAFNKQLGSNYPGDPEMLQYIDKPDIIAVCEAIFGDHFHVVGGSLWVTGAGRGMGIHVDYLPFPLPEDVARDPRITIPIFFATAHYYLDDLTLDLGPTTVVPGSHRAARMPVDESTWNGVVPHAVMLKAGDVCLFRSDLWHGAAKNVSDQKRYMVQVHYGHSSVGKWYPSISYESLYSPAVLAKVSDRQRQLLGDPHLPG